MGYVAEVVQRDATPTNTSSHPTDAESSDGSDSDVSLSSVSSLGSDWGSDYESTHVEKPTKPTEQAKPKKEKKSRKPKLSTILKVRPTPAPRFYHRGSRLTAQRLVDGVIEPGVGSHSSQAPW